jgi:hypothetical protein
MTNMALVSIERTPASASFLIPPSFTALETAILLLTASPTKAKDFALSMYERAAWGLDVDQIEHWARIVTQLARLAPAFRADE